MQNREQIIMYLPHNYKKNKIVLSNQYLIRNYIESDHKSYLNLMKKVGFDYWNDNYFNEVIQKVLPQGLFVIEYIPNNTIVGAALASHNPRKEFAFGGELGWVAVDSEHKGKQLGLSVSNAVVQRFINGGYKNIYLLTDDFRLPAIKTYLKLGFVPFYNNENQEMKTRWDSILKNFK